MKATLQIMGADLLVRAPGSAVPEIRLDGAEAEGRLKDWAKRYDAATRVSDAAALFAIGREMVQWLDASGWASAWIGATGARQLEILVASAEPPLAQALLDAPWELLAGSDGHLADDAVQLFELARRIGAPGAAWAPRHADLQLLFMAAAPDQVQALNFEEEEAGILEATARLPLHLFVEESGNVEFCGERLTQEGPFEALHLSCHGDLDPAGGAVLALEDEIGGLALTPAGE